MDEQQAMNQDAAITMARTAYMNQDTSGINTLLHELTNTDIVIDEVELLLQGKKINVDGKEESICEPLCNKEGASNMRRLMKSLVGRIILMSNFEEDQIRILTIELGNDMVEDLTFNKVRYEIRHPKAIATIVDLVLTNAFACAMSALENGTRRMLRGTTMETTINTQGNPMQRSKGSGGLGSIFGMGGK